MRRRFLVPVAFAFLVVLAVFVAPAFEPARSVDVMLASVPESVEPGATLPVVVEIVRDAGELSGGRNVPASIDATLFDDDERVIARSRLALGIDQRSRGMLTIPVGARGISWLELRARGLRDAPALRARIRVGRGASAVVPTRRARVVGVSPTNELLLVRAEGGACAPSLPCRVFVSEPAGSEDATYAASEGTQLLGVLRSGKRVRLEVLIDGFGGRIEARMPSLPGVPIELGVPVQLGSARFVALRAYDSTGRVELELERRPSPTSVQVDRYVDGRWLETRVFAYEELARTARWPSELPRGVHRFEARDPSGAHMASTLVVVAAAGAPPPWTHDGLGPRDTHQSPWLAHDPWIERRSSEALSSESLDDETRAASSLGLSMGSLERPTQLDSRVQRAMGTKHGRSPGTLVLAACVVLLGFMAAWYVARAGRRAQHEADALLEDAEMPESRRAALGALLPWTILLAFLAAAAMVLYRG